MEQHLEYVRRAVSQDRVYAPCNTHSYQQLTVVSLQAGCHTAYINITRTTSTALYQLEEPEQTLT